MSRAMPQVDETSNHNTVELPIGQTLELSLPENRTTGFKWNVQSSGEPICTLVNERYEAGRSVGQGGKHHWQFRAQQAGSADIELLYRRSWEEGKAAREFTLHVRVHK